MTNINRLLIFTTISLLLITSTALGQRPFPRKEFGPPPGTPPQPQPTPTPRPVIPVPVISTPSTIPVPFITPSPSPPHDIYHEPQEHRSIVTDEWRSSLNMIWNCKLNRQPCELKNGVNFIAFETQNRLGQETIVADLSKAAQIFDGRLPQTNPKLSFKASRLTTKNYFPARYRNACLFFSYTMTGQSRKQLYILQRNKEDVCVYSAEQSGSAYPSNLFNKRWIDTEIQLDLKYGDTRFFLDFEYDLPSSTTNYQELGFVEIRNFSIAYGNCNRNMGNECDSLQKIDQF